MNRPPITPAVLIVIDRDSRLSVLQDEGVQVVLVDERADPDVVVLLPRKNQAIELCDRLNGKMVVSPAEDHAGTAANAVRQLTNLQIITIGLAAETEATAS